MVSPTHGVIVLGAKVIVLDVVPTPVLANVSAIVTVCVQMAVQILQKQVVER